MNELWEKFVDLVKRIGLHPAVQEFLEDTKGRAIDQVIALLEDVLRGRGATGPQPF